MKCIYLLVVVVILPVADANIEAQDRNARAAGDGDVQPRRVVDEPRFLPVEDLIATSARVLIALPPEASEADEDRPADTDPQGRKRVFVSVRGMFPFKEQVAHYVDAMQSDRADATRKRVLIDFDLERQDRAVGEDEWSDWEPVDINVLRDVINSSAGIERDVVMSLVTSPVITCPLPERRTGLWDLQATHPRLRRFHLADDELELEYQFNEAMRSLVDQDDRLIDALQDEDPSRLEELIDDLAERFEVSDVSDDDVRDWIRRRTTLERELLLFRYLDFDVVPDRSYRYRVRLELRNPNYSLPLGTAAGRQHVVEGETRMTPWSEPTGPVRAVELE